MAAPYCSELIRNNFKIIHLVREPVYVIASLEGIGFWTKEKHTFYRGYVEHYLPEIKNSDQKSLYYWVYWNKLIPPNTPRIKIEDIANAPHLNKRDRIQLDWQDLDNTPLREEAERLAIEYGYGSRVENIRDNCIQVADA